ncbi:DUF6484 domain-containing protein [Corallococcus llansteffanensis]|uniref:DUF6484 domain-containing protein n=1 Tax=Corallococcus llansteffanensis TaxID=2316731 RepID=A0A3A8P0D3_9BACT|nr:DUF6484 domain-containing protein [Corallococcus llansteffanensis]RKH49249.1 hypothetical protein D7V93_32120 [Corallococcus llansteffanensis]
MKSPSQPSATEVLAGEEHAPIWGSRLGWIAGADEQGRLLVDFPGNRAGPRVARRTISLETAALQDAIAARQPVVLLFENGDPGLPLVIGMEQTSSPTPLIDEVLEAAARPAQQPVEAQVDGKRVVIEGEDEIVLQCGQASITLRRNGRVVIRGTLIESHASGTHRIKGGSVQIN